MKQTNYIEYQNLLKETAEELAKNGIASLTELIMSRIDKSIWGAWIIVEEDMITVKIDTTRLYYNDLNSICEGYEEEQYEECVETTVSELEEKHLTFKPKSKIRMPLKNKEIEVTLKSETRETQSYYEFIDIIEIRMPEEYHETITKAIKDKDTTKLMGIIHDITKIAENIYNLYTNLHNLTKTIETPTTKT